jgi:hypothetical protein
VIHIYRKKLVLGLIVLLLVFALVFFAALANFSRNIPTLSLGVPPLVENGLLMILAIASMIKVIWELYILEEHARDLVQSS